MDKRNRLRYTFRIVVGITLMVIIFSIAASSKAVASELIVNGGFETGDSTGWNNVNSLVTNENAHSGEYSLKMFGMGLSQAFQVINPPRKANILTFWARCANVDSCGGGFEISFEFDCGQIPGITTSCLAGTGAGGLLTDEWKKYEYTISDARPLKSIGIKIGNLETLIDDVSLTGEMDQPEQIPEFPTIAMPIVAIISLIFVYQRRKGK